MMRRTIFKNIGANWLVVLTSMMLGFFLTPFVLHHLGETAFGLWILLSSLTDYYGLLDAGTRNAVIRYVARFAAQRDFENLNSVASTMLASYCVLAFILVIVTVIGASRIQEVLQIPPDFESSARPLLLVLGLGMAGRLPLNLFAGILEGLQEFVWISRVQVIALLVRSGLTVLALVYGYGVITLGIIVVGMNVAAHLMYVVLVHALCPELKIHPRSVRWSTFNMLMSFGLVTLWIGIAQNLRFQTQPLVIGAFESVTAISFFVLASRLVDYATLLVQATAEVFTPMASHFDAQGDLERVRRVLIIGNRYASLVAFPLAAVLLVLGKSILLVWLGPRFASSYLILVILIVPTTIYLAQAASTKVLYGTAQHAWLARVLLLEGIANVSLSILLIRRFGIVGVAFGTAIPLLCTSIFLLPRHVCRLVEVRLRDYLREAHLLPLLLNAPLVIVLLLADRWILLEAYPGLIAKLAVGGVFYAPLLFVFLHLTERHRNMSVAVGGMHVSTPD